MRATSARHNTHPNSAPASPPHCLLMSPSLANASEYPILASGVSCGSLTGGSSRIERGCVSKGGGAEVADEEPGDYLYDAAGGDGASH